MSDHRLRELERRWRETGSPDDEAAYLLERVRVGDLTRERLELAACYGHRAAAAAAAMTPWMAADVIPSDETLVALGRRNTGAATAFALGALRRSAAHRALLPAEVNAKHLHDTLAAIEGWSREPTDIHRDAVERLVTRNADPGYSEYIEGAAWAYAVDAVDWTARLVAFMPEAVASVFELASLAVSSGEALALGAARRAVLARGVESVLGWCLRAAGGEVPGERFPVQSW